jgi:hypothetical protein
VGSFASMDKNDLRLERFVAVESDLSGVEGVGVVAEREATAAGC